MTGRTEISGHNTGIPTSPGADLGIRNSHIGKEYNSWRPSSRHGIAVILDLQNAEIVMEHAHYRKPVRAVYGLYADSVSHSNIDGGAGADLRLYGTVIGLDDDRGG